MYPAGISVVTGRRRDIGARADIDTADDDGTPTDESAILYDRCWLLGAWVVPAPGWIKLPVDEISGDAATSTDAGRIADVTFDY